MSMPHDPRPTASDAERAPAIGPARVPADLDPDEREVAGWFSHLGQTGSDGVGELDRGLRERILAALPGAESGTSPSLVESESVRRSWGWWTAAAAAVLLSVGLVALTRDDPGAAQRASIAVGPKVNAPRVVPAHFATTPQAGLWVMDDPDLALFHDLETFDGLGAEPGDVLALGDR